MCIKHFVKVTAALVAASLTSNCSVQQESKNNVGSQAVLAQHVRTPTEELVMNGLPPVKSPKTENWILGYTYTAKAWWIASRCPNLISPAEKAMFEKDLTRFTVALGAILQREYHSTREETLQYVQLPQMYALNEVSANKFFNCNDEAAAIVKDGMANAHDISEYMRSELQK